MEGGGKETNETIDNLSFQMGGFEGKLIQCKYKDILSFTHFTFQTII